MEFGDGLGGFGAGIRHISGAGGDIYRTRPTRSARCSRTSTWTAARTCSPRPAESRAGPELEAFQVLPSRQLSAAQPVSVPGATSAMEVADVTGDGLPDIVTPGSQPQTLAVRFRPTATGPRAARVEVALDDGRTFEVPVTGTGTAAPGPQTPTTPTTPDAGANARPPAVRAGCTVRRVRARATVTCCTSFRARPGLRVAIRLVRGGRVDAKADVRRAGRVKLRVLRPLPKGRFTVVTAAKVVSARQTRRPLVVRGA